MKKSCAKLFAALFLPLVPALFFSCATTNGAADLEDQKAAAENSLQEPEESALQGQEAAPLLESAESAENSASPEIAESSEAPASPEAQNGETAIEAAASNDEGALKAAGEEKISESEMRELEALLAQSSPADGGQGGEEESQSGAEESPKSGGVQYGSLLEKIRSTQDNKAEPGQNTSVSVAPSNAGAASAAGSSGGSGNASSANIGSSNGGAATPAPSASQNGERERVTSQGNKISGGPLIGPGSDKIAGGEEQETNEGIALAVSQPEAEEAVPEEKEPEPSASRSMAIKNNQFVDIAYPGSGWIYLGEEDGGDHFIFQGRKLGNGETTFTLRSKKPGKALLHFYKNDILTGNYIDDWIEIDVGEKSATDSVHQTAPSYAEAVPPKFDREKNKAENEKAIAQAAAKKQAEREGQAAQEPRAQKESEAPAKALESAPKKDAPADAGPAEKVQTVIQTAGQEKGDSKQKTAVAGNNGAQGGQKAGSSSEAKAQGQGASQKAQGAAGGSAKSLLERAQKAYDEKKYEEALDLVQQFFEAATDDFDAGLYLEGLILEAKSSVRNIKSAIDAYDTLIKNWPQSRFWRRANERAIYLKRFYIDIR